MATPFTSQSLPSPSEVRHSLDRAAVPWVWALTGVSLQGRCIPASAVTPCSPSPSSCRATFAPTPGTSPKSAGSAGKAFTRPTGSPSTSRPSTVSVAGCLLQCGQPSLQGMASVGSWQPHAKVLLMSAGGLVGGFFLPRKMRF